MTRILAMRLPGCAAAPERLKQGEVAPVEQEDEEDQDGYGPLFGELLKRAETRAERSANTSTRTKQADEPEERVDEHGDEAAANAGERHVDGDQFRGVDAKLIRTSGSWRTSYPINGLPSAGRTGTGCRRCWATTDSAGSGAAFACRAAGDCAAVPAGGGRPISLRQDRHGTHLRRPRESAAGSGSPYHLFADERRALVRCFVFCGTSIR